ncbi:uncharacterized protein METZ01_LOCUS322216 [marine metagenome]|uniref:Uncharacterized protein n=1 Tax=marine metagenome TaxID=408172 RepID=A0A382PBR7_9ZZZZ
MGVFALNQNTGTNFTNFYLIGSEKSKVVGSLHFPSYWQLGTTRPSS